MIDARLILSSIHLISTLKPSDFFERNAQALVLVKHRTVGPFQGIEDASNVITRRAHVTTVGLATPSSRRRAGAEKIEKGIGLGM